MAIRVTLECGHASMLRVRTTPEGYTHDWEVFVRGVDNADISQYIDKVVFNLHETFQKPKRILKEPPYIVKESGYAGFEIPIDVYLKNKDEPKRIQIQYDLHLQQSGPAINNVIRHHEVFDNPSEEFRKKLLKGGGIAVSHTEDSTEKGEFKMVPPMVSKPKLSGTDVKKHRMTEVRSSDEFSDLFGNIMTLPAKVSPENKRSQSDKVVSSKTSVDKSDRTEKPVKLKHSPHKEKKKDKKESADERKEKKDRLLTKEKDRLKEKLKRPQSPVSKEDLSNSSVKKNSLSSPTKKYLVPPVPAVTQKPPSPKPKEKQHKKMSTDKEKDKVKENFKVPTEERMFDRKKKKHKDDKNKDRKEKEKDKEHDKMKESLKGGEKKSVKPDKHEKSDKDKNLEGKVFKDGKKSPKYPKERDKVRSDKSSRNETDKPKDSHNDREKQKHKHKRKEKKEKNEEIGEKEKQEKKITTEKKNSYSTLTSVNPLSTLLAEMPERDSSDSTHSVDEDSMPTKSFLTPVSDEPEIISTPALSSEQSKPHSPRTVDTKNDGEERSRKDKAKVARSEERECRKRKRKVDSGPDEHVSKREKDRGHSLSPSVEPVSSSQSPISIEINSPYIVKEAATSQNEVENITENEQVAPDSTNSNFIEPETDGPLVFSDDYVSQLKDLQQKIMTLQDNQELQRVVQVIAETGQYEITRKTFDFDLCALDRTTVQRLQQFFSAS